MNNILRGALWMVATAFFFSAMITAVRHLEGRYPSIEVVFFRALFGLGFVIPPLLKYGLSGLKTRHLPMHLTRTGFALAAMVTFYYALAFVPIGDATAYSFIIPLFATLAAAFVLREHVDAPRWAATVCGFLGVLVMIRPGIEAVTLPVIMMIASAACYAGSWTSMKILTRTESASMIVVYMNAIIVPLALIPTLFIGTMPTLEDLPVLIGIGITGSSAHFCQARAFACADASAITPFDFLRLPFSVAFGWIIFSEPTDLWTWFGAIVIFASTYFITWRESRLSRNTTNGAENAD